MRTADVTIIGGGIMGCSTAYHLARRGCRVVLLEREPQLCSGSTGRCSGGVRHQFAHPVNVQLSVASICKIQHFEEEVGHPADFQQDGYLFLLTTEAARVAFADSIVMQRSMGVDTQLLSPHEVSTLVANFNLEDIVAGAYCPQDGIADPYSITSGYAHKAKELGAEILLRCEVIEVAREGQRVSGVITTSGSISSRVVVNAAGPWAALVGEMAQVQIPVRPYRRHVFVTHGFAGLPESRLMVIDFPSSFYFHREGAGVLMGMSDHSEPSSFKEAVDWEFLDRVIEVGVRRFPPLANASIRRAWTGLYEVTPDCNPILGEAPQLEGFYLANGFSGHGFMHGPIVGELLADLILKGRTAIDISCFGLDRFISSAAPPSETHVV